MVPLRSSILAAAPKPRSIAASSHSCCPSRVSQEHLVNRTPAHVLEGVPQLPQEALQLRLLLVRALDPRQHFADVAAVIAVVEERDVLPGPQGGEEFGEGARPFGELEHVEPLVGDAAAAADEVADVGLGELVAGEVDGFHAGAAEAGDQGGELGGPCGGVDGDAGEDVGCGFAGIAVCEFCDWVGEDCFHELGECAGALGDVDGDEGFFVFAEGGALGYEAEAVEVHVCAGGEGDELTVRVWGGVGGDVFLEARKGESAGRFDDRAGVFEDVFDGGAGFVGADFDYGVDDFEAEAEGFGADRFDGCAIGEEANFVEDHWATSFKGLHHRVCVVRLYAYDFDVRGDALDVDANPGDEPTTADAAEDGFQFLKVGLAEEFHAYCTLAGDYVGVIEGRDVGQIVELLEAMGFRFGGVEVVAF